MKGQASLALFAVPPPSPTTARTSKQVAYCVTEATVLDILKFDISPKI